MSWEDLYGLAGVALGGSIVFLLIKLAPGKRRK